MILLPRPPASTAQAWSITAQARSMLGLEAFPRSDMSLTPDQLQRIARLARIEVSSAELPGVTERLNQVLGLIDQLQALDTRGIEPMSHPLDAQLALPQRLRSDEVTETARRDAYQAVAPAVEQGLYLVPKVIE